MVNFKTYKQATGYRAINLARICRRTQEDTRVRIVAAVQLADLRNCVETGADCWVQHIDPVEPGKNTGWVTVEDVEEAGARGTILNHSEHKLDDETLKKTMGLVGDMAFEACLCAASVEEAKRVKELGPDFVAYEPPELIGSRDKSVASEKPEVVAEVVKAMAEETTTGPIPVLVGAGIHSAADVRKALELGAKGILVATDVVLAEDPEAALRELAQAFRSAGIYNLGRG